MPRTNWASTCSRRVKGRLAPTDEAHALFREVKEVFDRLNSLKQAARNLRLGEGGNIRAAVLPALGLGVAPLAVALFQPSHPERDVRLPDPALRGGSGLYEHEVDMALAFDAIQHPRLANFKIGEGELMMMFPRGALGENPPPRVSLKLLKSRTYVGSGATGPLSCSRPRSTGRT